MLPITYHSYHAMSFSNIYVLEEAAVHVSQIVTYVVIIILYVCISSSSFKCRGQHFYLCIHVLRMKRMKNFFSLSCAMLIHMKCSIYQCIAE